MKKYNLTQKKTNNILYLPKVGALAFRLYLAYRPHDLPRNRRPGNVIFIIRGYPNRLPRHTALIRKLHCTNAILIEPFAELTPRLTDPKHIYASLSFLHIVLPAKRKIILVMGEKSYILDRRLRINVIKDVKGGYTMTNKTDSPYRPTVRYAPIYKEYVNDLFHATTLDRSQIIRAALFTAAHSPEFLSQIEAHLKRDVPIPSPRWSRADTILWREQSPQLKSEEGDVTNESNHREEITAAADRTQEAAEQKPGRIRSLFRGGITLKL